MGARAATGRAMCFISTHVFFFTFFSHDFVSACPAARKTPSTWRRRSWFSAMFLRTRARWVQTGVEASASQFKRQLPVPLFVKLRDSQLRASHKVCVSSEHFERDSPNYQVRAKVHFSIHSTSERVKMLVNH